VAFFEKLPAKKNSMLVIGRKLKAKNEIGFGAVSDTFKLIKSAETTAQVSGLGGLRSYGFVFRSAICVICPVRQYYLFYGLQ
jgi:hypothetical protein